MFETPTDFDPGPGEVTITPNGWQDLYVLKLDVDGGLVWFRHIGIVDEPPDDPTPPRPPEETTEFSIDVAVDGNGNVYTLGVYRGTLDFDPGPSVLEQTSTEGSFFLLKMDANGAVSFATG